MTQEQIDSIRERMCDEYCRFPRAPVAKMDKSLLEVLCNTCQLNELEASAEPQDGSDCPLHKRWGIECDDGYSACTIVQRLKGEGGL